MTIMSTPATEHHNLITWLNHIKHRHRRAPSVPQLFTSPSTPHILDDMVVLGSTDNSIEGDCNSDTKIKPPSVLSKKFKLNLVQFHRPHGFNFRRHSTQNSVPSSYDSSIELKKSHLDSGSTSAFDADDELEEEEEEQDRLSAKKSHDLTPSDSVSTEENTTRTRENSVFSLPAHIGSPTVGYKKLRQDGDLVDYDDITVMTEEEQFKDDRALEIEAHSRSVIRNDLIRLALNAPFQSPIDTNQKRQVLHVGCGNGNWDVDIANLFPDWLVVGMDDKRGGPIQDQRKVPKNFKYIRCYYDLLTTLRDVPSESFDFVFMRFMIFSYSENDCLQLLRECERICKPGGFAEFYELDMRIYGNPKSGPITHKLNGKLYRVMENHNLNPRMARKLGDMVSTVFHAHDQLPLETDSTEIRTEKKKIFDANYISLPLGLWGGRLGVMFRDDINDLFEYFKINREEDDSTDLSISEESCEEDDGSIFYKDIETMDEEMEAQKSFMNFHHAYARKREK